MKLREYQKELLENSVRCLENHILSIPTGTGKGNLIIWYALEALRNHQRILICVPNILLVKNLYDRLIQINPFIEDKIGILATGYPKSYDRPVLITVYKSAAIALKNGFVRSDQFDLAIHDECHRALSKSWNYILENLRCKHIGFTATPGRLDGKPFFPMFSKLIVGRSPRWFIENKYLSEYKIYSIGKIDLNDLDSFNDSIETQKKLMSSKAQLGKTVVEWERLAKGKKTIIFVTTIDHAELLKDEFKNRYGDDFAINVVHNKIKDCEDKLNAFKNGKLNVLVNVEMLTMGIDVPDLECVVLCRFTYSLSLYLQMVGRVMRYLPNKPRGLILDQVGNIFYHGLPCMEREWDLHTQPTNLSRGQGYCCGYCETPLITRYKVIRAGKEGVKMLCPVCDFENHFVAKVNKSENFQPESIEGELIEFSGTATDLKIAKLITSKKRSSKKIDEILKWVENKKIDQYSAVKALKFLGLTDGMIKMYLSYEKELSDITA